MNDTRAQQRNSAEFLIRSVRTVRFTRQTEIIPTFVSWQTLVTAAFIVSGTVWSETLSPAPRRQQIHQLQSWFYSTKLTFPSDFKAPVQIIWLWLFGCRRRNYYRLVFHIVLRLLPQSVRNWCEPERERAAAETQDAGLWVHNRCTATLSKLGPKGGQQNRAELKIQQTEPTHSWETEVRWWRMKSSYHTDWQHTEWEDYIPVWDHGSCCLHC